MAHIKDLVFDEKCRRELLNGVNVTADAVSSTMGAQGRNILYETVYGKPKSTKDGVTVSKQIFLEDPIESLGSELVKEAAEKTVKECGDSTTNTIVLSREMMKLADEEVNKGSHPIELKRGIEKATADILSIIKNKRKKIKKKDYFNVANVSANNDKELGKIISDAFLKAGKNGVVLHDKSATEETHVNLSEGMLIDRGYSNRQMVTNKTSDMMQIENPYIFVCDREIDNINEIMFLVDFITQKRKNNETANVLIIGELSKKVEELISANRIKHGLTLFYLKAPSHASKRTDLLEDIAIATGAKFMRKDTTDNYAALGLDILGRCKKVESTKNETILDIDKDKYGEEISNQISMLEEMKEKIHYTNQELQRKFVEERIAKLSCSVATIMVGANSEVELDEKIDRVDDAVNALKSAVEEGILLGGGLALYNASFELSRDSKNSEDFNKGYKILQEAIRKPFRQILQNAGVKDVEEVENYIMSLDNDTTSYNVSTFEYCDFYKQGIIDPHKAIRCALQNASSVASTFLLTNTTITIKRNNESNIK